MGHSLVMRGSTGCRKRVHITLDTKKRGRGRVQSPKISSSDLASHHQIPPPNVSTCSQQSHRLSKKPFRVKTDSVEYSTYLDDNILGRISQTWWSKWIQLGVKLKKLCS